MHPAEETKVCFLSEKRNKKPR